MVLQKVHGLHATGMTLHERFSMLMKAAPDRVLRQKRAPSVGSINQRYNYSNRLLEQVARQLEMQAKRSLKQRLGLPQPGLRRFGSESSLAGLKRSNSFGNLSQQSVKNRVAWRQSNGNLSRSASINNLVNLAWRGRAVRGFRKRGGGPRVMRGRFRNGRQGVPRQAQVGNRVQQRRGVQRRGVPRRGGQQRRPGQRRNMQAGQRGTQAGQTPPLARRGPARGRGRGGMTRSQSQPRLLSKEELDAQLDQYMSCTKAALDQQLDNYMKNAMEME